MTYNLHPIIIHFPIALLFFYSLIKIFPVKSWFPKISLITTERFLLLIGTIGIFFAKSSGEATKHLTNPERNLVQMHELFANALTVFYVVLVVIEFLPFLNNFLKKKKIIPQKILLILKTVSSKIKNKYLVFILSLLGIITLFITGLLGGVITYGPTADPLAPFVLKLLGLS